MKPILAGPEHGKENDMRAAFANQPNILTVQNIQDQIAWAISLQATFIA
ncbi:hypothetical protein OSJ57_24455 [Sphingomonas sp. HH69]|tara:strand:- start:523 stop:669 length:147 start_codon:yes stop_codon:yes gene_type:complete